MSIQFYFEDGRGNVVDEYGNKLVETEVADKLYPLDSITNLDQYNISFSTLVISNPPSFISLVGSSYRPHSQQPYSKLWRKKSKSIFRPTIFF